MRATTLLPAATLITLWIASGVAFAHDWDDHGHKIDGGNSCHHHHEGMWKALPEEKRKLLHDAMEKTHAENKALHEQSHKLHEERDALLKAPAFDEAAYLEKSAKLDALHDKMKHNKEKAFVSVAGQFTPEERRILAVMQHMKHHHHNHHGEWHTAHHEEKKDSQSTAN